MKQDSTMESHQESKAVFKVEDGQETMTGFNPTRKDIVKRDPWQLSFDAEPVEDKALINWTCSPPLVT